MIINGITVYELSPAHGAGPKFRASNDGRTCTRHFLTLGTPENIDACFPAFLGYSELVLAGPRPYISRHLPHYMPRHLRPDGLPGLWAAGLSVDENVTIADLEEHGLENLPVYVWARLTVTYMAFRHKLREDTDAAVIGDYDQPDEGLLTRFVTIHREPTHRIFTFPRGFMYIIREFDDAGFPAAGPPLPEGLPVNESGEMITVHWIGIPLEAYPTRRIGQLLGTLNDAELFGAPEGALLFESAKASPIVLPNLASGLDVTYTWRRLDRVAKTNTGGSTRGVTSFGWRGVPHLVTEGGVSKLDWRHVSSNGLTTGTYAFELDDHRDAFRPE